MRRILALQMLSSGRQSDPTVAASNGFSNISLAASCANSGLSALGCHG
ncbi:MAG: SapB/AmfS family lantipeptide [Chloroflexi bacterium]|nr:hypothetical protein [Ktedonobacteraceae bacterium]MBV8822082.1 hypothetical protein [Ktedonobacteraceae bacterium]MBV9019758.1 hypothetical protein [Ktedonobacteraceae bacterium]MBV9706999.1 SapB/AmfS family lantipeptide [Chloroflexota bacterium]